MTLVAASNIDYISEDGSQKVYIPAGDPVKKGLLSDEVVEHLKTIGSIYEPTQAQALEPDERDARIAELEAQLIELRLVSGPPQTGGPEQPMSNPEGTEEPSEEEAKDKVVSNPSGPTNALQGQTKAKASDPKPTGKSG
jgi:hypothetical protein